MNRTANLRVLLIALWLGAALFFSFAVAPAAFAVAPSREVAGTLVNRTLAIINYAGLIVGVVALTISFVRWRRQGGENSRFVWIERFLLFSMTAACAVGQFVVGARLHELRVRIGRPIDEVAASDPQRVAFNDLHGYSVLILCAAMIAAAAAVAVIIAFFPFGQTARDKNYR